MKITIDESKKKKNLKKLKREALEVHRVPDDLDNDCDGAYGDGYEAGREYSDQEENLDEDETFSTVDQYNQDDDATTASLEEETNARKVSKKEIKEMKIKIGKKKLLTEAEWAPRFRKEKAPDIKKAQQQAKTKGKKWYVNTIKDLYKKWENAVDLENPESAIRQMPASGTPTKWAGDKMKSMRYDPDSDAERLKHFDRTFDAKAPAERRKREREMAKRARQKARWLAKRNPQSKEVNLQGQSIERSRPGGTPVTSSVPSIAQMAKDKMAREEGGYSDDEMRKRRAMGGQTPEITQGRSRKTRPFGMKESQNFHDEWRSFLKEEDSGEGTPASRLGDDLLKNLDQLEASTIDPEGGMPWIGADEVGEFIVDQGGEEQALAYIESMRQEIIDLMAEEYEELKFTEDHPEYDTSKMGEEEVEVEEDL